MNRTHHLAPAAPAGLRATANRIADHLTTLVGHPLLALLARLAMGATFFLSGRTKVDGFLNVNDSAYTLFREEYRLPLIAPEVAAHLAAYAEHLFPCCWCSV